MLEAVGAHLSKVQELAVLVVLVAVETVQLLAVHLPQEQPIQAVAVVVDILAEYLLVVQV
jgi:hypothetical protein